MITVGLPIYRQSLMLPVVLSGLSRQKNAENWELVICTEDDVQRIIDDFKYKLNAAGCRWVKLIKLQNWIPLPEKWRRIGLAMDPESIGLILQAGDCFPHENRIQQSRKAMSEGFDWYQEAMGYFYDLRSGVMAQYTGNDKHTMLNMCMAAKHAKALTPSKKRRVIDRWLYSHITAPKVYTCKKIHNGIDFAGMSNISVERTHMMKHSISPFARVEIGIKDVLPAEIEMPVFPIINILTRTLDREHKYGICRGSIKHQIYKNVNHIVGSEGDCEYCPDAIKLERPKQEKMPMPGFKYYPWNGFFTQMYEYCKEGWAIHIDDDDMFAHSHALDCLVRSIDHEDQLLLWRVNIAGRLVPGKTNFGKNIVLGDISGIGFMVHTKHLPVDWGVYSCADYRVIKRLSKKLAVKWLDGFWVFEQLDLPVFYDYFTCTQGVPGFINRQYDQKRPGNKQKKIDINNLPI